MNKCRICSQKDTHIDMILREMMFGTREEFNYFECNYCGTVQIESVLSPGDLVKHYPDDYYAYQKTSRRRSLKDWMIDKRDKYALGGETYIGGIVHKFKKTNYHCRSLQAIGAKSSLRVLDVGCGNGFFIDRLAGFGFDRPVGIDPFLENSHHTNNGAIIYNCNIEDLNEQFDVVMFHHSLEHVDDFVGTLTSAAQKMRDNGYCIVRIPTPTCAAYEKYNVNWVQLDAPRHIVIPSRKGMEIASDKAGLQIIQVIDESNEFQFWGSEQYSLDISLYRDDRSFIKNKRLFSREKISSFRRQAMSLNNQGRGDQVSFLMKKTPR